MIKKIEFIRNLGVFHDFKWDKETLEDFRDINIFYGRNYSGKTTLARVFRSFETGFFPETHVTSSFKLAFDQSQGVDQGELKKFPHPVRVFTIDFVRDNLRFLVDPESGIAPFAVLGEENVQIVEEIRQIEEALGSDEEGHESGLRSELKAAMAVRDEAKNAHDEEDRRVNGLLTEKARKIRGNKDLLGVVNYNRDRLREDIREALQPGFEVLSSDQRGHQKLMVGQEELAQLRPFNPPALNFQELSVRVAELVEKNVGDAQSIAELARGRAPDSWLREGMKHHGAGEACSFCNNTVSPARWQALERYFDESVGELEKDIAACMERVRSEKSALQAIALVNKGELYPAYHEEYESITERLGGQKEAYCSSLDALLTQLEARQKEIMAPRAFQAAGDHSEAILATLGAYASLIGQSNEYAGSVATERALASRALALQEARDFAVEISYSGLQGGIERLAEERNEAKVEVERITGLVHEAEESLRDKRGQLGDESKGAERVNRYLDYYFGVRSEGRLWLSAVEGDSEEEGSPKQVKFEVMRDEQKAFNLSQGEESLLAFCYFLAKLEDVETKDAKPVIWIDDPVSSLDGDHIFLVYGLLMSEIVEKGSYKQLFISTHNLDFLKYLKHFGSPKNIQRYMLVRRGGSTVIEEMPKYLSEYATEFNYLFHQLYKCSKVEEVKDENVQLVHDFGNNVRRFMELYLYYKYPDERKFHERLENFWGEETVPYFLTTRMSNEASHAGHLEWGNVPPALPEVTDAAQKILNRMREKDEEQFAALLKSIGEEEMPPGGGA